jgi:hypothetical protein
MMQYTDTTNPYFLDIDTKSQDSVGARAGDHKGPPHIHPSALAPTECDGLLSG